MEGKVVNYFHGRAIFLAMPLCGWRAVFYVHPAAIENGILRFMFLPRARVIIIFQVRGPPSQKVILLGTY